MAVAFVRRMVAATSLHPDHLDVSIMHPRQKL